MNVKTLWAPWPELSRDTYLHDMVSGPIDADKQDYLLRDSYFAAGQVWNI